MRTCFCLSAFLCVRESLCWGEAETELRPAGGEASDFHRGLRLRALPWGRGGLWPPTIWYRFAYAAYILLCVRLSPSSPLPSLSFPCYPLPPSLHPSLHPSGLQRLRQWRNQEFKLGGAQLLGARSTPPLVSSALHFTPSSCIICSPTALAMTFLPSTHLRAGGLGSSPGIFYIF